MAELTSSEVLAKSRFKTYRWNFYDTINFKTQIEEITNTLDKDGYRKEESLEGERGYRYTYYISHSVPFTVDVSLSNNDGSFDTIIKYEEDNSIFRTIYIAKIEVWMTETTTKKNDIVFSVQWQEPQSQPKLPSTNLICLTGIFRTDYFQYHLIHPYHYNPQDLLLKEIDLLTTDNALQLFHKFILEQDGSIKDSSATKAFRYDTSIDDGMLKIQFSENEDFFNSIEIVYII